MTNNFEYHLLNREKIIYSKTRFQSLILKLFKNEKFLKLLGIAFVLCYLVYLFLPQNSHHIKQLQEDHKVIVDAIIKSWNASKPFCPSLPNLDEMVNDPFIEQFEINVSLNCNKTTIYTSVNWQTGLVDLNPVAAKDNVTCFYSFFWRMFQEDNYIDYSQNQKIDPFVGIQLTEDNDLVNVSCYDKDNHQVYINTHMWIPNLKSEKKSNPEDDLVSPSVLVLFLESLGQLTFKKFMPLTAQALEDLGHMNHMRGFIKHEDNSFPNSMAMLTGEKVDLKTEETRFSHNYFDDVIPRVSYLWDDFVQTGKYISGFLEDLSIIGIFNYAKWGWKTPPTNWYPRAYWIQMYPESGDFEISRSMSDHAQFCFSGKSKVDLFLEQVFQFMNKMKTNNQSYFLFAFTSQVTHGDINNYKLVDQSFAKFFKQSKNFFKDTLLIFAGDHGTRNQYYFVPAAYGRVNERLNYVTIRVPEILDSKFPHLRKFLTANQDRLISWPDVHKLIKDVSTGDYYLFQESIIKKKGPLSPWRQLVHPGRTCDDAMINPLYCVCNGTMKAEFKKPERDSWKVQDAIKAYLANSYDRILNTTGETSSNCVKQEFNSTLEMSYMIPDLGQNWMSDKVNMKVLLVPSLKQVDFLVTVDQNVTLGLDPVIEESEEFREQLSQIMCNLK